MNIQDFLHKKCPQFSLILQIIGALILLKTFFSTLKKIYILLRRRRDLKKRYGDKSWVLITGSSDGIGRALAYEFAKQGFNIIISARTVSKLQTVQLAIKSKYPNVEVKILQADYKKAIKWQYIEQLMNEIGKLDISIIVNNVGVDMLQLYTQADPIQVQDLIALNCFPVAFISKYFLPILKKRTSETRKKCAIVNIASSAGMLTLPYFQVYGATKAFVDSFSKALSYQHPQLDIISFRPSQVSTPMTQNKQLDIFTISAESCANGILNQLGYCDKYSYGNWRHQLQGWIYQFTPGWIMNVGFRKLFLPQELKRRHQESVKL